jgi:tRNA A-37 threonylcarbamoyl transferase component Bud32/tetratricopeptide (TPR) repeat protein
MHHDSPPPPKRGAAAPSGDAAGEPELTADTVEVGSPHAVAARAVQNAEPLLDVGAQIGERYTVLGVLGKGGMGVVYAVYDAKLDRRVALKLLRTGRHASDGGDAEARRGRLLREAQAMARLNHPNVVSVYDVGAHADNVFVAMELVEGKTLRAWLKAEKRSWSEILACFVAAGRGLAAAHAANMIHRDFKADNVLVGHDGRVRVTDFGVVRLDCDVGGAPSAGAGRPLDAGAASSDAWKIALTQAGTAPGTPRYMAPEIFDGKVADARSDLFAFCVVLYEALCSVHPFEGQTTFGSAGGQRQPHPPRPGGHVAAPAWLVRAVERGLRHAPDERPPSMEALLADLTPRSGRERLRWLGAGAALIVLGGVATTGVVVARARANERAQLCQGGPARVAGVWGDAARRRLHDAFFATKKPYAADVWKIVASTLDGYGDHWAAMHRDSCAATRLRGEQTDAVMTLRMACLDRRLVGFSALVDVLSTADAAMLEKAAPAAAGLSSLDACADVRALMSEVPAPSDPKLRQQIADIRTQLSRAAALRLATRVADGSKLADRALEAARKTGDAGILAEALAEAGQSQLALDPTRAATLLREAFGAAFESHLDRVAATSAVRLMAAYVLTTRKEDAGLWERYAQAGIARIGGDDELESELWLGRAHGFEEAGRYDQALAAFTRAEQLIERKYGPDDLRTLRQQNNVILALTNNHRVLEARPLRAALLAREQSALGPHHPIVARTLGEIAANDVQLGHLDEAHADLGRAIRIYTETGGVGNTRAWMVTRFEALVLAITEGRMADGADEAHGILTMLDGWSMADSEVAYETRAFLGRAQLGLGQTAEATLMLRHTLEQLEKSHGKDNVIAGPILGALAEACARSGRGDEAIALERRNIAIMRSQSGEGSFDVAEARIDLARLLAARGGAAEALQLVDGNERALVRSVGEEGTAVVLARLARGEALLALGRFADAATALDAATATATREGLDPALRKVMQGALAKARQHTATAVVSAAR